MDKQFIRLPMNWQDTKIPDASNAVQMRRWIDTVSSLVSINVGEMQCSRVCATRSPLGCAGKGIRPLVSCRNIIRNYMAISAYGPCSSCYLLHIRGVDMH